jgi:type II secretory pathway component GspD/PulD (secretin)
VPLRTGLGALVKAGLCNTVEGKDGIILVKPEKKPLFGETQVRVYKLNYSEAQDVVKILPKMLSPVGSVDVGLRRVSTANGSNRSDMVVVDDIPEALDRVAEFLAAYDRPLPQIQIEAKFIETTMSNSDLYGIQWNVAVNARTGSFTPGKDVGFPLIAPNGIGLNNMVVGLVDISQLNATLQLLRTRGNSRVLANPSTMTLDNHTAKVSMGTSVPIREISSDPKTGLVLATWRSLSVPISLEVTPHVTSDGQVNMEVTPSVQAITGYMGPADDQRPIIATRSATADIVVGDGEVAVIGGLVQDGVTRNVSGIPWLGDIPILGNLFTKTTTTHTKNNLMIFIIPHIVRSEVESSRQPEKYSVESSD